MLEYRKSKSRNGLLKSPEDINSVYQLMDAWFTYVSVPQNYQASELVLP